MKSSVQKRSDSFQMKSMQPKTITNNEVDFSKKIIEEAKRQAYADMGLFI